MPVQLDILALEPFYGGARKAMLDSILRHSRHRWTLLRLPPRRIERRLAAAAHWFSEQLLRHWVGRVDVIFTSEALSLADLLRQVPDLADKPSVVYFHDNQLPAVGQRAENPLQMVNLGTASAATKLWFNSRFHLRTFQAKAASLVGLTPELAGRNPLPELAKKARVMHPPVDLSRHQQYFQQQFIQRDPRLLFVDTRDANVALLNYALTGLSRRGEKYNLVTVGPLDGLQEDLPRTTISEKDEDAQIRAMHQAAVMVSTRPQAPCDHYAIQGLYAGCWPVFPNSGIYPELLPASLQRLCLYESAVPERLITQLQNFWWIEQPHGYREELAAILAPYDALTACQAMDQRLEELAMTHALPSGK